MDCTIFCSFLSVDLADLAAGKIRDKNPLIKSIRVEATSIRHNEGEALPGIAISPVPAFNSSNVFPVFMNHLDDVNSPDNEPYTGLANMKVICAEPDSHAVESQLIALGGMRVRTVKNSKLHKFL